MLRALLEALRVPILSNSYPNVAISNIIVLDRHSKSSKISKALNLNVLKCRHRFCEGYSNIRVRADSENIRNGPLRSECTRRTI